MQVTLKENTAFTSSRTTSYSLMLNIELLELQAVKIIDLNKIYSIYHLKLSLIYFEKQHTQ